MGKIVKLKNKKTGVRVYPVTATSAVVDANSGERLNDTLQNKVEEAPVDGNQYVRINGTWGVAQMATSTKEKCIITLASNQGESDAVSIYGATVKVTDVDSQEVYHNGVWDGTEIALEFAPGVNYKVEVGAVADYATPESKTLTALDFNVRNLVMTYNTELVSVTLSADNGADVIGQQVTINGSTSTWNGTAITKKFAYGTSYEVSVDKKEGYATPSSQKNTANQSTREIRIIYYEIKNGIFIHGISGRLYSKEEWNEQETINGIAVITDNVHFVISLPSAISTDKKFWNNNLTFPIEGVLSTDNLEEAILDLTGKSNTEKLAIVQDNAGYGSGVFSASYCYHYKFPNGSSGYLGSCGELKVFADNIEAINSILDSIHYPIDDDGTYYDQDLAYWSSTQYNSQNRAWVWLTEYSGYRHFTHKSVDTSSDSDLRIHTLPFGELSF